MSDFNDEEFAHRVVGETTQKTGVDQGTPKGVADRERNRVGPAAIETQEDEDSGWDFDLSGDEQESRSVVDEITESATSTEGKGDKKRTADDASDEGFHGAAEPEGEERVAANLAGTDGLLHHDQSDDQEAQHAAVGSGHSEVVGGADPAIAEGSHHFSPTTFAVQSAFDENGDAHVGDEKNAFEEDAFGELPATGSGEEGREVDTVAEEWPQVQGEEDEDDKQTSLEEFGAFDEDESKDGNREVESAAACEDVIAQEQADVPESGPPGNAVKVGMGVAEQQCEAVPQSASSMGEAFISDDSDVCSRREEVKEAEDQQHAVACVDAEGGGAREQTQQAESCAQEWFEEESGRAVFEAAVAPDSVLETENEPQAWEQALGEDAHVGGGEEDTHRLARGEEEIWADNRLQEEGEFGASEDGLTAATDDAWGEGGVSSGEKAGGREDEGAATGGEEDKDGGWGFEADAFGVGKETGVAEEEKHTEEGQGWGDDGWGGFQAEAKGSKDEVPLAEEGEGLGAEPAAGDDGWGGLGLDEEGHSKGQVDGESDEAFAGGGGSGAEEWGAEWGEDGEPGGGEGGAGDAIPGERKEEQEEEQEEVRKGSGEVSIAEANGGREGNHEHWEEGFAAEALEGDLENDVEGGDGGKGEAKGEAVSSRNEFEGEWGIGREPAESAREEGGDVAKDESLERKTDEAEEDQGGRVGDGESKDHMAEDNERGGEVDTAGDEAVGSGGLFRSVEKESPDEEPEADSFREEGEQQTEEWDGEEEEMERNMQDDRELIAASKEEGEMEEEGTGVEGDAFGGVGGWEGDAWGGNGEGEEAGTEAKAVAEREDEAREEAVKEEETVAEGDSDGEGQDPAGEEGDRRGEEGEGEEGEGEGGKGEGQGWGEEGEGWGDMEDAFGAGEAQDLNEKRQLEGGEGEGEGSGQDAGERVDFGAEGADFGEDDAFGADFGAFEEESAEGGVVQSEGGQADQTAEAVQEEEWGAEFGAEEGGFGEGEEGGRRDEWGEFGEDEFEQGGEANNDAEFDEFGGGGEDGEEWPAEGDGWGEPAEATAVATEERGSEGDVSVSEYVERLRAALWEGLGKPCPPKLGDEEREGGGGVGEGAEGEVETGERGKEHGDDDDEFGEFEEPKAMDHFEEKQHGQEAAGGLWAEWVALLRDPDCGDVKTAREVAMARVDGLLGRMLEASFSLGDDQEHVREMSSMFSGQGTRNTAAKKGEGRKQESDSRAVKEDGKRDGGDHVSAGPEARPLQAEQSEVKGDSDDKDAWGEMAQAGPGQDVNQDGEDDWGDFGGFDEDGGAAASASGDNVVQAAGTDAWDAEEWGGDGNWTGETVGGGGEDEVQGCEGILKALREGSVEDVVRQLPDLSFMTAKRVVTPSSNDETDQAKGGQGQTEEEPADTEDVTEAEELGAEGESGARGMEAGGISPERMKVDNTVSNPDPDDGILRRRSSASSGQRVSFSVDAVAATETEGAHVRLESPPPRPLPLLSSDDERGVFEEEGQTFLADGETHLQQQSAEVQQDDGDEWGWGEEPAEQDGGEQVLGLRRPSSSGSAEKHVSFTGTLLTQADVPHPRLESPPVGVLGGKRVSFSEEAVMSLAAESDGEGRARPQSPPPRSLPTLVSSDEEPAANEGAERPESPESEEDIEWGVAASATDFATTDAAWDVEEEKLGQVKGDVEQGEQQAGTGLRVEEYAEQSEDDGELGVSRTESASCMRRSSSSSSSKRVSFSGELALTTQAEGAHPRLESPPPRRVSSGNRVSFSEEAVFGLMEQRQGEERIERIQSPPPRPLPTLVSSDEDTPTPGGDDTPVPLEDIEGGGLGGEREWGLAGPAGSDANAGEVGQVGEASLETEQEEEEEAGNLFGLRSASASGKRVSFSEEAAGAGLLGGGEEGGHKPRPQSPPPRSLPTLVSSDEERGEEESSGMKSESWFPAGLSGQGGTDRSRTEDDEGHDDGILRRASSSSSGQRVSFSVDVAAAEKEAEGGHKRLESPPPRSAPMLLKEGTGGAGMKKEENEEEEEEEEIDWGTLATAAGEVEVEVEVGGTVKEVGIERGRSTSRTEDDEGHDDGILRRASSSSSGQRVSFSVDVAAVEKEAEGAHVRLESPPPRSAPMLLKEGTGGEGRGMEDDDEEDEIEWGTLATAGGEGAIEGSGEDGDTHRGRSTSRTEDDGGHDDGILRRASSSSSGQRVSFSVDVAAAVEEEAEGGHKRLESPPPRAMPGTSEDRMQDIGFRTEGEQEEGEEGGGKGEIERENMGMLAAEEDCHATEGGQGIGSAQVLAGETQREDAEEGQQDVVLDDDGGGGGGGGDDDGRVGDADETGGEGAKLSLNTSSASGKRVSFSEEAAGAGLLGEGEEGGHKPRPQSPAPRSLPTLVSSDEERGEDDTAGVAWETEAWSGDGLGVGEVEGPGFSGERETDELAPSVETVEAEAGLPTAISADALEVENLLDDLLDDTPLAAVAGLAPEGTPAVVTSSLDDGLDDLFGPSASATAAAAKDTNLASLDFADLEL